MRCRYCKSKISHKSDKCPNCNRPLIRQRTEKEEKIIRGVVFGTLILYFTFITVYFLTDHYYFSDKSDEEYTAEKEVTSPFQTIISTDHVYSGVTINTTDDAYKLIQKDSIEQKTTCDAGIIGIENDIINNYGVTAVNLCELDSNLAIELEKVIATIYIEYPGARNYLTNLSLKNNSLKDNNIIAVFVPTFKFANSTSRSKYAKVYKTEILLNASFFLNEDKLMSTVKDSSITGHFPANATKYSPVAHELGHYLSFIALLKESKTNRLVAVTSNEDQYIYELTKNYSEGQYSLKLLKEAYNNYINDGNTVLSFDAWRKTISGYAVSTDDTGSYIYDETIAEAFHDEYLNGDNASLASKYILQVLQKKLES